MGAVELTCWHSEWKMSEGIQLAEGETRKLLLAKMEEREQGDFSIYIQDWRSKAGAVLNPG